MRDADQIEGKHTQGAREDEQPQNSGARGKSEHKEAAPSGGRRILTSEGQDCVTRTLRPRHDCDSAPAIVLRSEAPTIVALSIPRLFIKPNTARACDSIVYSPATGLSE